MMSDGCAAEEREGAQGPFLRTVLLGASPARRVPRQQKECAVRPHRRRLPMHRAPRRSNGDTRLTGSESVKSMHGEPARFAVMLKTLSR